MLKADDTIAAVATPMGEGGIAIVRVSGKDSLAILQKVFFHKKNVKRFRPGLMHYGYVKDDKNNEIDEAMAVYFRAPFSYTREDVCEIHTHAGVCAEMVLERLIRAGARPAERGEFTYRAFLNGRISLDRAEAVMSLISAQSAEAAKKSLGQLKNGCSSVIRESVDELKDLLTLIDAAADFPEEIDEEVTAERVRSVSEKIARGLKRISDPAYARVLHRGVQVVIAGAPNAGKSSIMNRLLSFDRSIVTDVPGTTRDVISESVSLKGLKITLSDTAGIRETPDEIERQGVRLAEKSIREADVVLLIIDASEGELSPETKALLEVKDERFILVANKDDVKQLDVPGAIRVSAKTGEGIQLLLDEICRRAARDEDDEKLLTLRHIESADAARKILEDMLKTADATPLDLLREDVTQAMEQLCKITGENLSESVIDAIFENFCVGK